MTIQTWSREKIPSKGEMARELGAKEFSCGLWVDPPGQRWLNFFHETDELVLVIQGKIRLEVDGDAIELVPGKEALIPAGANHSVYNIGGTEARWFYGYHR
jgi:quercetin dioxygenase-like cupin family protein